VRLGFNFSRDTLAPLLAFTLGRALGLVVCFAGGLGSATITSVSNPAPFRQRLGNDSLLWSLLSVLLGLRPQLLDVRVDGRGGAGDVVARHEGGGALEDGGVEYEFADADEVKQQLAVGLGCVGKVSRRRWRWLGRTSYRPK